MRTSSSMSMARFLAACGDSVECARIASTTCCPIVYTGLSEVIGSWKLMDILLPRSLWGSSTKRPKHVAAVEHHASASTSPGGLGTRPMTESEVTLLPQPDSRTRLPTAKSMPSTARNSPRSVSCPSEAVVEPLVEGVLIEHVRPGAFHLLVGHQVHADIVQRHHEM